MYPRQLSTLNAKVEELGRFLDYLGQRGKAAVINFSSSPDVLYMAPQQTRPTADGAVGDHARPLSRALPVPMAALGRRPPLVHQANNL